MATTTMSSSSFAASAARKATERYVIGSTIMDEEDKENNYGNTRGTVKHQQDQQLDKVVESVANATKRLSQASTTTTNSSKRKSQNHVGPWRLGRTLGRGSTGRVRLAKHSITGQLAAVKIVPKLLNGDSPNHKKTKNNIKIDKNGLPYGIEREIIIMKVISHSNIMALYDVWENKNELYLVLEYIEGGELFDYLVRKGRLQEKEAVTYFKQIISGLQYCHKFNICHRDLKPENLLLDKSRRIKIADFGMATLETTSNLLETSCGSPHYASPEIVAGKNYHGGPSDIWSAGIILFALLTGRLPFDDPNIRELLLKVQTGVFKMPQSLSAEAKDLIWKMLRVDPKQRITIDQILKHPLITKYDQFLKKVAPSNDLSKLDQLDFGPIYQYNDEILKNLQTLWHGVDLKTLKQKLSSNEKNSEKIFYQLLKKHLNDHQRQSSSSAIATANAPVLKKTIPRSTSIVTTTIIDENGTNVKSITKEIPIFEDPSNNQISTTKTSPFSSQRKALGAINQNTLKQKKTKTVDGKKQGISASSSYKKVRPYKTHQRNCSNISRSSSKRSVKHQSSIKSLRQAAQNQNQNQYQEQTILSNISHPPLPEKKDHKLNVMDFMYLCDEIFGEEEEEGETMLTTTASAAKESKNDSRIIAEEKPLVVTSPQRRRPTALELQQEENRQREILALKQSKAKEELKQLEAAKLKQRQNFVDAVQYKKPAFATATTSSLDPSANKNKGKVNNANEVLNKFGVRLSRFGNWRDMKDFNNNNNSRATQLPAMLAPPPPPRHLGAHHHQQQLKNRHNSMISSKSISTRDLKHYLNEESSKDLTIEEFNKRHEHENEHATTTSFHGANDTKDMSFDFSINEVVERVPISPVDPKFFEPKMYYVSSSGVNSSATVNEKPKRKHVTATAVTVDERYLDADTSSSGDDILPMSEELTDEDISRIVGAFNNDDDLHDEIDDSMHKRQVALSCTTTRQSKLHEHDIATTAAMRQEQMRASIFSKNLSREATNKYKKPAPVPAPVPTLPHASWDGNKALRNSVFNKQLYGRDDSANDAKILRLSIYEDPDTTMSQNTMTDNIQEMDHESLELVDMDLYDKQKNVTLMAKFVTRPVAKSSSIVNKLNRQQENRQSTVIKEEAEEEEEEGEEGKATEQGQLSRRKTFKKFFRPKREAPSAPSFKTYNFDDMIESEKKKSKSKNSNNKTKSKTIRNNKIKTNLKRLLRFF